MESLRILVVEDDAFIADDICSCLQELGHISVGPAYNLNSGKELIQKKAVQLALLDIHMEKALDGIELAKWINENCPVPIIFLTAFADEITLHRAKEVHPAHYLVKPFDKLRLKVAIEIAAANYYSPDTMYRNQKRLYRFNLQLNTPLSTRELEVVRGLIQGLSNKELAETLHLSEHTVKSHLKTIFLKTEARSRTELISKINQL